MKYLSIICLLLILRCTSEKKAEAINDTIQSPVDTSTSSVPTAGALSKEKVYWLKGSMYERDILAPLNPLEINYNDTARVVDTLTFQKQLGFDIDITRVVDTAATRLKTKRYIIRYKESEICIYQYKTGYTGSNFITEVHSALINNKEIVLKNGVKVGMTKRECLEKYPYIEKPSDIIYIDEGELSGHLRFEFTNDILEHIEFWGKGILMNSLGSLNVFTSSKPYISIIGPINADYFTELLGENVTTMTDTLRVTGEGEDGYPKEKFIYHHLVNCKNSQFYLEDSFGEGTYLNLLSAYISTPKVKLTDGLHVGMPREELIGYFGLPADIKVAWINTETGKMRFECNEDTVISIEISEGKMGR